MGPLTGDEWDRAAAAGAEPTVWTPEAVAAATAAGDRRGSPLPVHLKLDTGMGRLGARDPRTSTRWSRRPPRRGLGCAWPA